VCVCSKIDKWKNAGKLQAVDDPRFEFVHKDYLPSPPSKEVK
jgi:hypothetical protein